jgi:hypothetical protein
MFSAATICISDSSGNEGSKTTAAGFPRNRWVVNASSLKIRARKSFLRLVLGFSTLKLQLLVRRNVKNIDTAPRPKRLPWLITTVVALGALGYLIFLR